MRPATCGIWAATAAVLIVGGLAGIRAAEKTKREPKPAEGQVTVKLEPRQKVMGELMQYYRPIRIALRDKPPEGLKAEPEYLSEKPLYGELIAGEGPDNHFVIVVDEAEKQPPRIYIDRNNDKDLTNDGPGRWTRGEGPTLALSNVTIEVPYKTGTVPYTFEFYRFTTRMKDVVLYYRNSARMGTVECGGKSYQVALLDENADGRFDDVDNDTLLIDLNGDGKLVGDADSAEHHAAGEPFNIHGAVWEVASIRADGRTMILRPSSAKVEMKPYLDPGYPAPPFTGKGLDGKQVDLRKIAADARLVLVDFWATWCGPCRAEFPSLKRLHARYKDHGLRIVGVNLDEDHDQAAKVAKEAGMIYPHVFDGKGWKNAVAVLYRVHGIPQTYLLDKDLKIVAVDLRGPALEARVKAILGPGDEPEEEQPAKEKPGASVAGPSKDSRLKGLRLYLGCGPVGGPGTLVQVEPSGKTVATIQLPQTPYSLAVSKTGVIAALPGANRVVAIDRQGKVSTLAEGAPFQQPIAVAVHPVSGDVLVADNHADILALVRRGEAARPTVLFRIPGRSEILQNASVAIDQDGMGIFATDAPAGVYRFAMNSNAKLGEALVETDADVAADPSSPLWAAASADGSIRLFKKRTAAATIPMPAGTRLYRGGCIAFGPNGTLVVTLESGDRVEPAEVHVRDRKIERLFPWRGDRLVSIAVGPAMPWNNDE